MIESTALVEKFKYALENKWGYVFGGAGGVWTASDQKLKVNYMIKNFGEDWQKNADAKNNNYYRTALYGSKWIGHNVADCSGMFVWAFKQFGYGMSHISSQIYLKYCTAEKGQLTADLKKKLLPGTAVFTGSTASNHPHVGLYVGNGKCIEAAGVEAGVVTSNITANKWTWYGKLKNVSYPAQEAQNQPSNASDDKSSADNFPTLKRGDKGSYVTLLQTKLIQKGFPLPKYGADGDFGAETLNAVKAFQKANGLVCDGIVGEKTWDKLMEQGSPVYYSVIVSHLTESQAKSLAAMYDHAEIEIEKG